MFVFFPNSDFSSRMPCDFFRTTLFLERLLFHNFSEWLLRHNSYIFGADIFFRAAAFFSFFQNSHFVAAVIFSEQLLFQNENFAEQPILENEKFFMAVTFRNSCFSLFRIKLPKKELLFQGRYFYTASTFPEKLHFGKS